jgi:hypothetical protein
VMQRSRFYIGKQTNPFCLCSPLRQKMQNKANFKIDGESPFRINLYPDIGVRDATFPNTR